MIDERCKEATARNYRDFIEHRKLVLDRIRLEMFFEKTKTRKK